MGGVIELEVYPLYERLSEILPSDVDKDAVIFAVLSALSLRTAEGVDVSEDDIEIAKRAGTWRLRIYVRTPE